MIMTKTISCSQMAKVLGRTTTSIRECIARDKFAFAQCWQTDGKKGRTFDIDKEGFKNYLLNSLGWTKSKVDSEFKGADIYE
uniref:Regulatory phage protein cox n=1 Tax=Myoviridae sp. ctuAx8 TaxID=2825199 RepID=A0A8S5Q159_9CAUD|nr:MAG TPA: Regulatory phage protein cox [Myoviridae sp. ctuAx8]